MKHFSYEGLWDNSNLDSSGASTKYILLIFVVIWKSSKTSSTAAVSLVRRNNLEKKKEWKNEISFPGGPQLVTAI